MRRIVTALALATTLALGACGKAEPPTSGPPSTTRVYPRATTTTVTVIPTVESTPPIRFDCATQSSDWATAYALAEVWRKKLGPCGVSVEEHVLTKTEQAAVKQYRKHVEEETPEAALRIMLDICANPAKTEELSGWNRPVLVGAHLLCPKAPHAETINDWATGRAFNDGEYAVGSEVVPGTYKTGRVTDCYWERSTRNGDIIANNYITNAPGGATVTIRKSDGGFTSRGCGEWRRA